MRKWLGSVDTPNGPIELTFLFKAEGEALTGSVSSAMGTQDISNGKVAGEHLPLRAPRTASGE